MQTSERMRALIGSFERCRLAPYQDAVGVWTIGYGHTGPDVTARSPAITQHQADELLREDLRKFEEHVERLCPVTTQHQFDALVSFAFNLGQGSLSSSTLRRLHNAGDYTAAANEFQRWNKGAGRVLPGLVRRRAAEAAVYADGTYA
jgi:lysozyme